MRKFLAVGTLVLTVLGLSVCAASAAEPKTKPIPQRYKSVDENGDASETSSKEYFKGEPVAQTNNIFVGAGLDYFDSFGVQARYALRFLDKGPLPDLNNSLYLEAGFGMTFYGTQKSTTGVTGFNVLGSVRWDFQLNSDVILFSDLGLGFNAVSSGLGDSVSGGKFFPAVGIGAMYNFSSEWAARADLSYQFLGFGMLYRF